MLENKKLAILLPNVWRGGMLRNAFALAKLITHHEWEGIGRIEVILGLCRDGPYDWPAVRRRMQDCEIGSVRSMEWASWPAEIALAVYPCLAKAPPIVQEIAFPRDYRHNFLDCDAWIVFGHSLEGYLAALRPFAVYCADVIQRYVPEIFGEGDEVAQAQRWSRQTQTFLSWRMAAGVFSTTPHTRRDVISYAGVRADRALLAPTLIDPPLTMPTAKPVRNGEPGILWVTNPSPHKNHQMAITAARIYYEDLQGTLPLTIVGSDTHQFNPALGLNSPVANAFKAAPEVLKRVNFVGEVSDARYAHLIGDAAVIWHNVIIDNGTFVAFDAARSGKHFVSSDYPQMRYLCDRYGISPIWHPANDPIAAAGALRRAQDNFVSSARPLHSLKGDTEAERKDQYGEILRRLLSPAGA